MVALVLECILLLQCVLLLDCVLLCDTWMQRSLRYNAGQEQARGNSSSRCGAQIEAALARLQIGLTASEFSAKGLTVREVPLNPKP
jgi:hypothetical protein